MSRPKYRWWGFARKMVRDYPDLKMKLDELHTQSMSPDISGMPRGGSAGRTTESIALRQLPPDDQQDYDAVRRAIEITRQLADGDARIALIRYAYWGKKMHKLEDAALQVHVSERTAQRWHADFIRLVGKCYGYKVGVSKPK